MNLKHNIGIVFVNFFIGVDIIKEVISTPKVDLTKFKRGLDEIFENIDVGNSQIYLKEKYYC